MSFEEVRYDMRRENFVAEVGIIICFHCYACAEIHIDSGLADNL